MATSKEAEKQKRVTVKLIKAHEHGGKEYQAGDEIPVWPHQKVWLEERGKVEKSTQIEGQ